jgi:diguanylate cyclase (GGDEF)-like protein/PAS domain S-box-containing protein
VDGVALGAAGTVALASSALPVGLLLLAAALAGAAAGWVLARRAGHGSAGGVDAATVPAAVVPATDPAATDPVATARERRVLLEVLPVAVALLAPDGQFVWGNATYRSRNGIDEDTPGTFTSASTFPDIDQPEVQAFLAEVASGRQPAVTIEHRLLGAGGVEYDARVTIGPAGAASADEAGVLVVVEDVTSRNAVERALAESEALSAAVVDALGEGVVVLGPERTVTLANEAAARILGAPAAEVLLGAPAGHWFGDLFRPDLTAVDPADRPDVVAFASADEVLRVPFAVEVDGATRWLVVSAVPIIRFGDEQPVAVVCSFVDDTERVAAERALKLSEARLRATADGNFDAFYLTEAVRDGDGTIVDFRFVDVNQRGALRLGSTPERLIGRALREVAANLHAPAVFERCVAAIESGDMWEDEAEAILAGGIRTWVAYTGVPLGDTLALTTRDVTERRRAEEDLRRSEAELAHRVRHDELTGLANRSHLMERLGRRSQTGAPWGRPAEPRGARAVLFVDLDRFKPVNDTHGHEAGDVVLVTVARRLEGIVRDSDVVARLGGDEFVIVLEPAPSRSTAEGIGRRIVEELARPVRLADGTEVVVGASVGLVAGHAGDDPDELLRRADAAAYRAKAAGRGRLVVDGA